MCPNLTFSLSVNRESCASGPRSLSLVLVLGEIHDRQTALRKIRRVLKRTGRVVVGELFADPHMVRLGTLQPEAEDAGLAFETRSGSPLGFYSSRCLQMPCRERVARRATSGLSPIGRLPSSLSAMSFASPTRPNLSVLGRRDDFSTLGES